jgi:hypothetical protein
VLVAAPLTATDCVSALALVP